MARSDKCDQVRIEVPHQESGYGEWMWLFGDRDSCRQQLVFGQLDSDPVVVSEMRLGQIFAVTCGQVRDLTKPSDLQQDGAGFSVLGNGKVRVR